MDIELRQLRCAVALGEHGNFGKAARAVHLSQPAFSRNIQELESRVGKRLFLRGSRGAQLTDEGAIFLEEAKKLLRVATELTKQVRLIRGQSKPTRELRAGVGMYPADLLLAETIVRFMQQHQDIRIRITADIYTNIVGLLQRGEIDFAVIDVSSIEDDTSLQFLKLSVYQGRIVVRKGHPLLENGRTPVLHDLQRYPWVMPASASADRFRKLLTATQSETKWTGVAPEVYVNSVPLMSEIVANSDGWTILSLSNVADDLLRGKQLELLPVPLNFYKSNFAVTWIADRALSPGGQEFIEVLLTVDAEVAKEETALEQRYRALALH